MKKSTTEKGITLVSLVITVIIMTILAGVALRTVTTDEGTIQQAKEAKRETEMADIEEQIQISILQVEGEYDEPTMDNVIQKLIENKIITDETQVDTATGTITIDKYVFEGKLAKYIVTE